MRTTGKIIPGYRKHRGSGQAIVTLNGKDHYLGPHGSKVSKNEYDRLIAEWLARGRTTEQSEDQHEFAIVELILAYSKHCRQYYRKNGKITNEVTAILNALKVVKEIYGRQSANDFGPLKLQVVQNKMIELGWCRSQINKQISRVIRAFRWGVSKELINANVAYGLREVAGLRRGRTAAKESQPVLPVADALVDQTLPLVSSVVADMIRLQRLTGMRPAEVCQVRPSDVDTTGDVWKYRPESHKTEHHGHSRVIAIGPRGQDILRPYLLRASTDYCFSPVDSEKKRRQQQTENRKTPSHHGNRVGTNRKRKPEVTAGPAYTTDSYRRAIKRGCDKAKIPAWAPNQLRHSAATRIRAQFGLEAAQVTLGHSNANITQVYAERDLSKAIEVARQVG